MRAKHFLATIFAALALAVPAQAKDAHCTAAKAQVAAMAAKLPSEVDAVTQTTAAKASCTTKQIVLKRSVALKQSRMEADFKDFLQKQDNTFVCADKGRRALVDAGWTWMFGYTFQDGDGVIITASCGG